MQKLGQSISFDPTSIGSMVLMIEETLNEIELLDQTRALGHINTNKIYMAKTTLETAKIYSSYFLSF